MAAEELADMLEWAKSTYDHAAIYFSERSLVVVEVALSRAGA
jgi:hypothetical protein